MQHEMKSKISSTSIFGFITLLQCQSNAHKPQICLQFETERSDTNTHTHAHTYFHVTRASDAYTNEKINVKISTFTFATTKTILQKFRGFVFRRNRAQ